MLGLLKRICPICALVSSTWIVLLILRYAGYEIDESLIAMLMGGSAVGISYVLSTKSLGDRVTKWKLVSIPTAFLAAWLLLHYQFGWFISVVIIYALVYAGFRQPADSSNDQIKKIEHELENCC